MPTVNPQALPVPAVRLDPEALAQLRALDPEGRHGLLPRVAGLFEASLASLLPQLDAAEAAGDLAAVRHVAHTLKSSSASLGALALSRCCAETERQVREAPPADLAALLGRLRAELDRVRPAIAALGQPGP